MLERADDTNLLEFKMADKKSVQEQDYYARAVLIVSERGTTQPLVKVQGALRELTSQRYLLDAVTLKAGTYDIYV
jgi:hypothetical protein